mmetsp:Transcript_14554/g.30308  ORF Transcript_14554/g.30308 Transcript_14554/m.30308 type:complete len:87 (-) Transcript_14554:294-554(-)
MNILKSQNKSRCDTEVVKVWYYPSSSSDFRHLFRTSKRIVARWKNTNKSRGATTTYNDDTDKDWILGFRSLFVCHESIRLAPMPSK